MKLSAAAPLAEINPCNISDAQRFSPPLLNVIDQDLGSIHSSSLGEIVPSCAMNVRSATSLCLTKSFKGGDGKVGASMPDQRILPQKDFTD